MFTKTNHYSDVVSKTIKVINTIRIKGLILKLKLRQIIILTFTTLIMSLVACQSLYVMEPTKATEAILVAESYENGMTTVLELPYLTAYQNLKGAYQYCIAFSDYEKFVYTDNLLEEHLEQATLFAKTPNDHYLHKATLEKIAKNQTRLTLFLPHNYRFAKARFKQDIKRALGQDRDCNKS